MHSVTSSYIVSHHHATHHEDGVVSHHNTVSHHHAQCHIIIHSVTSSCNAPWRRRNQLTTSTRGFDMHAKSTSGAEPPPPPIIIILLLFCYSYHYYCYYCHDCYYYHSWRLHTSFLVSTSAAEPPPHKYIHVSSVSAHELPLGGHLWIFLDWHGLVQLTTTHWRTTSSPATPALNSSASGLLNSKDHSRLVIFLNFAANGPSHLNSAARSPGPRFEAIPKDIFIYTIEKDNIYIYKLNSAVRSPGPGEQKKKKGQRFGAIPKDRFIYIRFIYINWGKKKVNASEWCVKIYIFRHRSRYNNRAMP